MLNQGLLEGTDVQAQIELEMDSVREGVRQYHRMVEAAVGRGDGAAIKAAERMLALWFQDMTEAIADEHRAAKKRRKFNEPEGRTGSEVSDPVLLQLKPEPLALIAMHHILGRVMQAPSKGVPFTSLCHSLGTAVIAEVCAQFGRETGDDTWKELHRRARRIDASLVRKWHRQNHDDPVWEKRVCIAVGARLAWLFVSVAVLPGREPDDEWQAAVLHSRVRGPKRTVGILRGTPRLWEVIEEGHLARQHLRPRHVPMIIPPLDWSAEETGGYVRTRTPMVARMTRTQRKAIEQIGRAHV